MTLLSLLHETQRRARQTSVITQRIKETLALLDVRVLDHFVVGGGDAYSFANHGLL